MSSKREPVSLQFSASKQGTDKSKERTGSGTSFPIRYRSLEDYDDEDLTILTGQYDKPEREERTRRTHSFASSLSSAAAAVSPSSSSSSSLPSKSTPPLPPKFESKSVTSPFKTFSGDVRDDKKTLLANIRGKIHKKWEELSGESSSSPENENEKCPSPLRKQNSDESTESQSPKILNLKSQVFDSLDLFSEIEQAEELTEEVIPENGSVHDELFINDGVPEEEPLDDSDTVSSGSGITFEPITSSPSHSTHSTIRERIRGNPPKNLDPNPIVMSNLMTEEVIDNDGRIYYDAEDEEKKQTVEEEVVPVQKPTPPPPPKKTVPLRERKLPLQKLLTVVVLLFGYLIIPMPSYVAGIITGAIITSALWMLYIRFLSVYRSAYRNEDNARPGCPVTPRLDQLAPLLIPEMRDPKQDDIQIYKGWMNELYYYDSENYHINKTNSVYVRLEGVSLRLSSPKVNVPRRAMYDENLSPPNFIHQRHYDMKCSRVFLQPPGLVKKRLWSKKYPICIALSESNFKKAAATPQKTLSKADSFSQSFDMGFEVVTEQSCNSCILYLFARTGREKEEWFKRFQAASQGNPLENHILEIRKALKDPPQHKRSDSDTNISVSNGIYKHRRHSSMDSVNSSGSSTPSVESTANLSPKKEQPYEIDIIKFSQYMGKLMPATAEVTTKQTVSTSKSRRESSTVSASTTPSSPTTRETPISDLPPSIIDFCEPQLLWMNALIGRCLWDFLQDKSWTDKVMEKLQRKLSKIHVPYFIEELKITDIDLGTAIPIIQRSSKPYLDERGFWVDLQTTYSGGFKMTIATKVNLMKLKKSSLDKSPESSSRRSAVTDSNEEDSAESSTDEEPDDNGLEESGVPQVVGTGGSGASRKILKYINKITQSKYFQQATEYKYIKMAMEEVSNTPLILTVEVHNLNGTLTINVPPPPTDRLWYGFRDNPQLTLVAKPKVGEREVTVTHVTEWIEKKLIIEFQRLLVFPNLDDLLISFMSSPNEEAAGKKEKAEKML